MQPISFGAIRLDTQKRNYSPFQIFLRVTEGDVETYRPFLYKSEDVFEPSKGALIYLRKGEQDLSIVKNGDSCDSLEWPKNPQEGKLFLDLVKVAGEKLPKIRVDLFERCLYTFRQVLGVEKACEILAAHIEPGTDLGPREA